MTKYKVGVHVHTIYGVIVEAPSQSLAEEVVEDQIVNEDNGNWKQDYNAGWTDVIGVDEVMEDDMIYED